MASALSSAEYAQDQLDARDDLKEDGYIFKIESTIETGERYNPVRERVLTDHYCIPIALTSKDLWGVVKETDHKYICDALNLITNDCKVIDKGMRMNIVRLDSINLDNTTNILYEIICR